MSTRKKKSSTKVDTTGRSFTSSIYKFFMKNKIVAILGVVVVFILIFNGPANS